MTTFENNSPVLVMMFAANCPHCVNFKKNQLDKFRSLITSYNKVNIVEINVADYSRPNLGPDYPKDLSKVRGFPGFALIPASTWRNGKAGQPMKHMLIYGMVIDGEKVVMVQVPPMTAESITAWVKTNIENDAMFSPSFVEQTEKPKVIEQKECDRKLIYPSEGSCYFKKGRR